MAPLISIIIPINNLAPYLNKCIDSILNQSFVNLEVILINDGSKDESGKICTELSNRDNRIKVIHKEYGGVSSARNAGIKVANGEYIGFVDGDDCIDQNMYRTLYSLCKKTNADIAVCKLGRIIDGKLINNSHEKQKVIEMDNIESMRQLFTGALFRFSLCNKLFKKSCFENISFPEGRIHEDLATTYRLFANSKKAVFTSYIGYYYIKRENSILTSKFNEKRLDAFIGWDEILPFMSNKYELLKKEVFSSYSYWCIDNIYYILNQVEDKEDKVRYLRRIQYEVGKNFMEIMEHATLSLKYKYLLSMLRYSLSFLLFSTRIKKLMEANT